MKTPNSILTGGRKFGAVILRIAILTLLIFLFPATALPEQRFPPPEFESGHVVPTTSVPEARGILLQYADLAVLAGCLGIAAWLVYKRRSRKGVLYLGLFSLLYFGFYRKGCVCSIGSIQNVALALCSSNYAAPLTVLGFFLLPLFFVLFSGRVFCSGVCPHGALQDLVLIKPLKVPYWLEQGLGILPFIYLGAGVIFAATETTFIFCQYDPFVPLFRMSGRMFMVTAGVILLLLGMFIGRPYCRFLCPYGALLRIAGSVAKLRVRVTPTTCTQCRLCEGSCPFGAMREPESSRAELQLMSTDRRRLGWLLVLLPVLMVVGGAIGEQFGAAASHQHSAVRWAQRLIDEHATTPSGAATADDLELARIRQQPNQILSRAAQVQKRFALSGIGFGAWTGLVIGVKLLSLALRRNRSDFEPDPGACVACARCFESCPEEIARLGLVAQARATLAESKPQPRG
jgi:NosR/NirI family transcriptional regulator, nitrous oxide reductase regulator